MAEASNVVSSAKPTRIMVAVNQSSKTGYPNRSSSTIRAYQWVLDKIARSNPSCFHLHFVHIMPADITDTGCIPANPYSLLNINTEDKSEGDRRRDESAKTFLRAFLTECRDLRIRSTVALGRGDPAKEICSEVKKFAPDLLVLGCRGLGVLHRLFLPNVSEYCVKNAECPVVAIKRRPEDTPANYSITDD